jgi:hypothetical protein
MQNQIPTNMPENAKKYNRIKIVLSIIEFIIALIFISAVLFTGFSLYLRRTLAVWPKQLSHSPWIFTVVIYLSTNTAFPIRA